MASGLPVLNHEQLAKLARLLYNQEVGAINEIKFSSEPELAQYLGDCKACYNSVVGLLKDGSELERNWFRNIDKVRASIAEDIHGFIVNAANHALQTVRRYDIRMDYVKKIREHAKNLGDALKELDNNEIITRGLAKESTEYRNVMLEYARTHRSPASRQFSIMLKERGITFEQLVQEYQGKLKLRGPFTDLAVEKKMEVYEEIIEASGQAKVKLNLPSKVGFGVAGIGALLLAAGMKSWDIYSAENPFETAVYDAVTTVAGVGGAMLGEVVGAALATSVTGVQASSVFVVMAGITFSIAGAFLLGTFAAWLMDLIIGSGGSAPLSTDGIQCYASPLPDGTDLAREIAYHHKP